jgi:drug/metabolite transporter (DMT)-like permease
MSPLLLFLTASLIWGSTWIAITYQLGDIAPEASVAYRFGLAAGVLLLWCRLRGVSLRYTVREHVWMAVQGVLLFGVNYVLVYHSERFLASGLVAVVFSLIVFCNMIGMRLVFGQAVAGRTVLAGAMGVAGVALLFQPEIARFETGGTSATGLLLAVGATVVASCGNLAALRNHRAGLPVQASTGYGMLYGAAVIALWAWLTGVEFRFSTAPGYLASLAYLALFGSVLAFVSYLTLVGRMGADRAGYVGVVVPAVALLLSSLLEGYRWTPPAVAGLLLCLGGNVLVLLKELPKTRRAGSVSSRAGP